MPVLPAGPAVMQQTRVARRVYIGGLTCQTNEEELKYFMIASLSAALGTEVPPEVILEVYINYERKFAFCEMRTVELSAQMIAMTELHFKDTLLKLRRPNDYVQQMTVAQGGVPTSSGVPTYTPTPMFAATPQATLSNRLILAGVPDLLGEPQVRELCEAFGALKFFHLVLEESTGKSKGVCLFEFFDESHALAATAGLHELTLGAAVLACTKAPAAMQVVTSQPSAGPGNVPSASAARMAAAAAAAAIPGTLPGGLPGQPAVGSLDNVGDLGSFPVAQEKPKPTCVIALMNLVSMEDLADEEEYEDICEDVREEVERFGPVVNLVVPRAGEGGAGKVFVEYGQESHSEAAANSLGGRTFAGRQVVIQYYDEVQFAARDLV